MMTDVIRWLPQERDVAYFVDLHLDTATLHEEASHRDRHSIYRVEGKARPMLVINVPERRHRGRRWFQVLAITSKGRDGADRPRKDVTCIGAILDGERQSFVVLRTPRELPENMLCHHGSRSPIVKQLDRLTFDNIFKIAQHKLLKGRGT